MDKTVSNPPLAGAEKSLIETAYLVNPRINLPGGNRLALSPEIPVSINDLQYLPQGRFRLFPLEP